MTAIVEAPRLGPGADPACDAVVAGDAVLDLAGLSAADPFLMGLPSVAVVNIESDSRLDYAVANDRLAGEPEA
jgi:hypothetical protein